MYNPTNSEFDPNAVPSSGEFDPVLEAQKEEQRQKEIGDANEAAGLNRDGSPKAAPVAPVAPAAPVASKPGPADFTGLRDMQIPHVKDAPGGGASLTEEALLIKEKLAKQPKFPFFIPLDPGEVKGAYRPVIINGYRCEVKKGVMVQLPESIYQLLLQSYQAEAEATNHENNLETASPEKRRALGLE